MQGDLIRLVLAPLPSNDADECESLFLVSSLKKGTTGEITPCASSLLGWRLTREGDLGLGARLADCCGLRLCGAVVSIGAARGGGGGGLRGAFRFF